MRRVTLKTYTATGAAVALAGLLAVPVVVAAAPVTGSPSVWSISSDQPHVLAGVPVRVTLSGDASKTAGSANDGDADPAAALSVLPPGISCPKSYAETIGEVYSQSYSWKAGDPKAAPFRQTQAITFDQPGRYTACGYYGLQGTLSLADDQDATTLLYEPVVLEVQRPTVTADVRLDGPLYPGATVKLVGSATSNAPESVTVALNRADQACQTTAPANNALDQFSPGPDPIPVYGTRVIATTVTLPNRVGDYRLCVYGARDRQDGDPDLTIDTAGLPGGVVQVREAPAPPAAAPVIYGTGQSGTTKPDCRLTPFTPKVGQRVTIRCKGISGTVAVALRRSKYGPTRYSRTIRLDVHGRGTFTTKGMTAGPWFSTVRWNGLQALSSNVYLKPAKVQRRATKKTARPKATSAAAGGPRHR